MQEENIVPRERTLRLLAEILKTSNQEVPFDVPELWFGDDRPSLSSSSPSAGDAAITEKVLLSNCRVKKNKGEHSQGRGQVVGRTGAATHIYTVY